MDGGIIKLDGWWGEWREGLMDGGTNKQMAGWWD